MFLLTSVGDGLPPIKPRTYMDPFVALTHEEGLVIKLNYTPDYVAGVVAGFGLASFCLFLVAVGTGILGGYRIAAALLGLLLIVFSIVWKLRIQKRD